MITYHQDVIQGSDDWHQMRLGLLTGSELRLILTPTLRLANNDKLRAHVWEIAAQRISEYVEPTYIGDAMLRGKDDEIEARLQYSKRYAPVKEVGFVTNDKWGFTLGCSPDGLVGDDGGIECKSRCQKYQVQTIVENYRDGGIPDDFMLQVQGSMLICERKWWDFISYSGGLPMAVIRVHPIPEIQDAIVEAAAAFEAKVAEAIADYRKALDAMPTLIPTERRTEQEMFV